MNTASGMFITKTTFSRLTLAWQPTEIVKFYEKLAELVLLLFQLFIQVKKNFVQYFTEQITALAKAFFTLDCSCKCLELIYIYIIKYKKQKKTTPLSSRRITQMIKF